MPKRRRLGADNHGGDQSSNNTIDDRQNTRIKDQDDASDLDHDMDDPSPGCHEPPANEASGRLENFDQRDLDSWRSFSLAQLRQRIQDLETIIQLKDDSIAALQAKSATADALQANQDKAFDEWADRWAKLSAERTKAQEAWEARFNRLGALEYDARSKERRELLDKASSLSRSMTAKNVEIREQSLRISTLGASRHQLRQALAGMPERDKQIQVQSARIRGLEEDLGRLQAAMAGMGQMSHGSLAHRESQR